MKQAVFFIAVLCVISTSCKKGTSTNNDAASLDGKWRMIVVKDNGSGLRTVKPASIQGDVDIRLTSTSLTHGFISGNTPTNEIAQNDYTIGDDRTISIPNLGMTQIMETSWGDEFVGHITNSREYSFDIAGNLSIITPDRTLTFKKL